MYEKDLRGINVCDNKIRKIGNKDDIFKKVSINYLNIENNNLSRIPTVIGFMKLSGLKIDGNPLKLVKRTVIDKGTVSILDYLRTKHSGEVPEIPRPR